MTPLAAYLLLFSAVGIGFILVHLVVGKIIRPNKPGVEKDTIYECGEPTIGNAWVQFDLRYYVIALLFVIFDVEVAFFFPWAEVFGKSNQIAATSTADVKKLDRKLSELNPNQKQKLSEESRTENHRQVSKLSAFALLEIAIFFGVLLVGFAYLWKRGDLAWVRSMQSVKPGSPQPPPGSDGDGGYRLTRTETRSRVGRRLTST